MAPAGRYTRSGGTGALVGDQVADDRVLELFLDGHTVVLQGLHRLWPPLIDFAGALTTDLGHPVQVNAYITPASSQGFSAHYDVHDVFVLQVAGEKRWRIHEPVLDAPSRDQPWTDHRAAVAARAEEPPVIDAVLRPGDALYLPRGYLHAAEALGGVTCHLTVGVHPVTRQHVLDALLAVAVDEPTLRSSLPMGVDLGDPAAVEDDLRATIAALTERLRTISAVDVATRLGDRLVDSNRPAPVAPLAQAAALEALDADSVLVSRAAPAPPGHHRRRRGRRPGHRPDAAPARERGQGGARAARRRAGPGRRPAWSRPAGRAGAGPPAGPRVGRRRRRPVTVTTPVVPAPRCAVAARLRG